MDKIGLITITYNSADVVEPFLNCIWQQTYTNFRLYVVDNSSVDNTVSILKKDNDKRLFLIENKENYGVAKANNQAISNAIADGCDQILIINNDVTFEPALLEKMLEFQSMNNCSLVVPKIMYYDNPKKIWYAGSWFLRHNGHLPIHRGMHEIDGGQYDKILEVEYAPTCCLLVRKEVFEDVGVMNEKYFVYFDDVDFCYRILQDGNHKIFYYPHVDFFHKVGSLTKSFYKSKKKIFRGDFFIKQNIANHVYFLKQIGSFSAYLFIVWLFFKNNIRFFINSKIRKNISTWWLINKSYFRGLRM